MPRYQYTATDPGGNRQSGEWMAADPEELATRLQAQGLQIERVDLADPADRAERLSSQEVADLARHIGGLTRTGLPLPSGLRALGAELPPGRLRRALDRVAAQVEAGTALDQAIEAQGDRFPDHLRGLVLAGVRSGKLGQVLEQFVTYDAIGADLRRQVRLSLAYPILLLAALAGLFIFVSFVVVKGLARFYTSFNLRLPPATELLLLVSGLITETRWWVPAAALGLLLALGLAGRAWLNVPLRRRLAYRIPLVGPLWRWTALAEFSHLLGLLVESEVSLVAALPLAGSGVGDADIADACRSMARDVAAGQSLAESVARVPRFPAGLAQVLRWAEGHQSTPEALHMAGEMFEARARNQAAFISSIFSPVAVIVVLAAVGFVALALFMPMVTLIQAISG